ncbi:hypothetical protein L596_006635 [Steinernema carpocapsae]|uniref:Uncharacterized protein n=1 Tax=Steinernema carpocapsae TaxID=34508 RepID=A0A4U8V2N8_STECR|nr:hypothetical protein L596_006635 [Steinernema carpocapsae]
MFYIMFTNLIRLFQTTEMLEKKPATILKDRRVNALFTLLFFLFKYGVAGVVAFLSVLMKEETEIMGGRNLKRFAKAVREHHWAGFEDSAKEEIQKDIEFFLMCLRSNDLTQVLLKLLENSVATQKQTAKEAVKKKKTPRRTRQAPRRTTVNVAEVLPPRQVCFLLLFFFKLPFAKRSITASLVLFFFFKQPKCLQDNPLPSSSTNEAAPSGPIASTFQAQPRPQTEPTQRNPFLLFSMAHLSTSR